MLTQTNEVRRHRQNRTEDKACTSIALTRSVFVSTRVAHLRSNCDRSLDTAINHNLSLCTCLCSGCKKEMMSTSQMEVTTNLSQSEAATWRTSLREMIQEKEKQKKQRKRKEKRRRVFASSYQPRGHSTICASTPYSSPSHLLDGGDTLTGLKEEK